MINKILLSLMIYFSSIFAQISEFSDDFEDGALTGWSISEEHKRTFELTEESGELKIDYHRTSNSEAWDVFILVLPQNVDVSDNPKITLDIKSDVSTVFTIKPHYTNGNSGWIQKEISEDNLWRTYTFDLSEINYISGSLTRMAFYLDGGTTRLKSGTIFFDNLQIAGYSIEVFNILGEVIDSSKINLSWECNNYSAVNYFNVYRGNVSGFPTNAQTKIGETFTKTFQDDDLTNNTNYYYVVSGIDSSSKEYPPSAEYRIRTFMTGNIPLIKELTENSNTIGKYEKFELKIEIEDAAYQNPYNPDEIKLYAYFKSHVGDTIWINGFYDDYESIDEWKIRFSPNIVGQWEYRVYVSDVDGIGNSEKSNFTVINSEYHGQLQVSPDNSHYLTYSDGTPFYGVGAYYNARVTESGLDRLVDNGANYFAYWNGNNDYEGGAHQIESARTGIGYYDQDKCRRVDQIIQWAEDRKMQMQFAIWPHDILDKITWGYNDWDNNAFKYVCEAEDFYTDSISWEYQEKLYRYIIARWGYSRSLAVWELVNEIHGTDGWVYGDQTEALKWVKKINDYFKNNDPYNRLTTIDKGTYWPDAYEITDLPSVHLYENQWNAKFSNNPIRSSYWVYSNVASQFYNDFNKPGIMAEAGGSDHFFGNADVGTEEYTLIYHNSIWASWANGLAMTPLWWNVEWLSDNDLAHLKAFSNIGKNINYSMIDSLKSSELNLENADGFIMEADTIGFGWIRAVDDNKIISNDMSISGFSNGTYQINWIDTWTGNTIDIDTAVSVDKILTGNVTNELEEQDAALLINKIENGIDAQKLNLFLERKTIAYYGGYRGLELLDSTKYNLVCYITNDEGQLVASYNDSVDFILEGPGNLKKTSVVAYQGGIVIEYLNYDSAGVITITANSNGLQPAILSSNVVVTDLNKDDYFWNNKITNVTLYNNYPNPFNPSTNINFSIPNSGLVTLKVYNVLGQQVAELVNQEMKSGTYTYDFDASNLSSGLYVYQLITGNISISKKMLLIK